MRGLHAEIIRKGRIGQAENPQDNEVHETDNKAFVFEVAKALEKAVDDGYSYRAIHVTIEVNQW